MNQQDSIDTTALQLLDHLLAFIVRGDCEESTNCLATLFPSENDRASLKQLFGVIRRHFGMNAREAFGHACRVRFTAGRLHENMPNARPSVRMVDVHPLKSTEKRYLDYRFGDPTPIRLGRLPPAVESNGEPDGESILRARLREHLLESTHDTSPARPRPFLLPRTRYTPMRLVRDRVLYRGGRNARLEIEFEPPCEHAGLLPPAATESRMLFGTGDARYLRFLMSGRTTRRDEPARLAATPGVQFIRELMMSEDSLLFMLAPSMACDDGSRTLVVVHEQEVESITLMPSEEDRAALIESAARMHRMHGGETTHPGWIPASGSYLYRPLGSALARHLWNIAQTLEPSTQRGFG